MGAMCGKASADDAANREIDNQLKKDQNKMKSEVKLLLLGTLGALHGDCICAGAC